MSPKRAVWTDAETRKSPSSVLSLSSLLFDDTSLARCGTHWVAHTENGRNGRPYLSLTFGKCDPVTRVDGTIWCFVLWRLTVHALRVTYTILLTIHKKYDASCVFFICFCRRRGFFFASSLWMFGRIFFFSFFCDANRYDITHSLCADSVKEPSNKCAEWRTLEWPQKPKSRTSAVRAWVCVCGRSP